MRDATLLLYQTESHPRFVRFLFAIDGTDNRAIIAKVFAERLDPRFGMLVGTLTSDPRHRTELEQLSKMIVYSLGFRLLEDRALERPKPTQRTLDYADWVVGAAADLLAARIEAAVVAKADSSEPTATWATIRESAPSPIRDAATERHAERALPISSRGSRAVFVIDSAHARGLYAVPPVRELRWKSVGGA